MRSLGTIRRLSAVVVVMKEKASAFLAPKTATMEMISEAIDY
jgi:hypothetical protein